MIARADSEAPQSGERVHLERCKICGEWINRLNLEQVVQHLDHSRIPTAVLATGAIVGPAAAAS
jgi:hypothetical protein